MSKIKLQRFEWNKRFVIRPLQANFDKAIINEQPHRHEWQEIIYIHTGKGKQRIDNSIIEIKEHSFYLIAKGQIHEFFEGKNLDGFLIRFNDELLPEHYTAYNNYNSFLLFGNIWSVNELSIDKLEIEHFYTLLKAIQYEYDQRPLTRENMNIIIHYLMTLLAKLGKTARKYNSITSSTTLDGGSKELQNFILLVEDHYKTEHDLAFYINMLHTDIRRLRRIVKLKTGYSPKQLITQRVMEEAKRLLNYTNLTFKEIAIQIGYEDPAYFSRHFKSHEGVSPKKYKEETVRKISN